MEEKLREACCVGDTEAVIALLAQNVDINSKNSINGWTALHWACKRGNEEISRVLLNHGADTKAETSKGETPAAVCTNPYILSMLGETNHVVNNDELGLKFTPNYIRSAPLNGQVDMGRMRPKDFSSMPTTALPALQNDGNNMCWRRQKLIMECQAINEEKSRKRKRHGFSEDSCLDTGHKILINGKAEGSQIGDLVLKIRIAHSSDPDFIEIDVPRWKLTYNNLLKMCSEELEISDSQIERIRKLPNTRLRKDSDVKRLTDFQELEIVLKSQNIPDKTSNCYQSISTCRDQTILY